MNRNLQWLFLGLITIFGNVIDAGLPPLPPLPGLSDDMTNDEDDFPGDALPDLPSLDEDDNDALDNPAGSLPPLPSFDGDSKGKSSSPLKPAATPKPAPAAPAKAAANEQPVMLDQLDEKAGQVRAVTPADISKTSKLVDDIRAVVNEFVEREEKLDKDYQKLDHELDDFYQQTALAIGRFGGIIQEVEEYLARKAADVDKSVEGVVTKARSELKNATETLEKLKGFQKEMDKDEDSFRSFVLQAKQKRVELVRMYSQASGAKNDLLSGVGMPDEKSKQLDTLLKDAMDLKKTFFDTISAKASEHGDAVKKRITEAQDVGKALSELLDTVRQSIVEIGSAEERIAQEEESQLSRSIDRARKDVDRPKASDGESFADEVLPKKKDASLGYDLARHLGQTLWLGMRAIHSLFSAIARYVTSHLPKTVDVEVAGGSSQDSQAQEGFARKRMEIRSLVWTIVASSFKLFSVFTSYVVDVVKNAKGEEVEPRHHLDVSSKVDSSVSSKEPAMAPKVVKEKELKGKKDPVKKKAVSTLPEKSVKPVKPAGPELPKLPSLPGLPDKKESKAKSLPELPELPPLPL
jgi:phage shock protein A